MGAVTEHSAPPNVAPGAPAPNPVSRVNADRDQEEVALLLMRVARGDRKAFRQLHDLTSGRFHGLAERLLSRRDVAEEVLQEVYVRVWLHAGSYDPARGAPMPWLWQVLRNAVIDRLRRDRMPLTDLEEISDTLAAPAPPLEARLDLTRGLARLDAKKGAAVAMAFVDGYTHEEIAEVTQTPLGTVKSQVRRGLASLRDHLESEDPEADYQVN
jgi:RNA polymerase sigma-70 factor, ECF subfamily